MKTTALEQKYLDSCWNNLDNINRVIHSQMDLFSDFRCNTFLCGDHESHEDMEKELKVFAEALDEMLNYQEKLYDEYKLIYKHIRGE